MKTATSARRSSILNIEAFHLLAKLMTVRLSMRVRTSAAAPDSERPPTTSSLSSCCWLSWSAQPPVRPRSLLSRIVSVTSSIRTSAPLPNDRWLIRTSLSPCTTQQWESTLPACFYSFFSRMSWYLSSRCGAGRCARGSTFIRGQPGPLKCG